MNSKLKITGTSSANNHMCGRYTLTNKKEVKKKFEIDIEPNFNICPSSKVLVYTNKPEWMEWNYSPSWAKKPMNLINARYETIDEKPSFKDMNRCVFIMDGWYEWKTEEDEKIPYFHHADGDIFFFAGVYGGYRGKLGCAIVTMEALETTKEIHERMPLIVARSHFKEWLEGSDSNSFDEIMVKSIKHHRVSTHVNNPTNNDPKCIFPTS